jgi:hypothetical protein
MGHCIGAAVTMTLNAIFPFNADEAPKVMLVDGSEHDKTLVPQT